MQRSDAQVIPERRTPIRLRLIESKQSITLIIRATCGPTLSRPASVIHANKVCKTTKQSGGVLGFLTVRPNTGTRFLFSSSCPQHDLQTSSSLWEASVAL